MVDRAELRKLAEACKAVNDKQPHKRTYSDECVWQLWDDVSSPDVVLGLLDRAANAEKDFHDSMELVRKYSADLAAARAALRDPDLMRGLFGAANGQAAQRWASFHADAIAAAQAEKEVSDE